MHGARRPSTRAARATATRASTTTTCAARSPAPQPGDKVEVWFQAERQARRTRSRTRPRSESRQQGAADGRRGLHRAEPRRSPRAGPQYLDDYDAGAADADIGYDVYDVDALRTARVATLGVLSPLQGRDLGDRRRPLRRASRGAARRHRRRRSCSTTRSSPSRDYMNDGGKAARRRQDRAPGRVGPVPLQPARPTPPTPFCASNQTQGQGRRPTTRPARTSTAWSTSNDFQQYWLGAYLPITLSGRPGRRSLRSRCSRTRRSARGSFTLNGADSADNQDNLYSFLTTSSILQPGHVPAVQERPGDQDRPAAGLRSADRHAATPYSQRRARPTSG